MAQALMVDTKLKLAFETGLNEKGEPILKSKTFSNIKKEATADGLLSAAQAVGTLTDTPIVSITRNDSYTIVE
ncbi:DUF1659 domain-containing protein [Cytobacillus gottheilii]|uniref:DUF1659 domain-containing protein n=2 Tax=Bacillaceae TaxID=186817 RepID=A0A7V7RQC0_9BACI|nr:MULTISPECIES: DUF1659 domain-containing protein [Bacillaceae]KAB2335548.1 DUF1659 domain-containing protein [Bacillus mesophilum]QVY63417.1 DUF1659 domain-containing protein [Cytobacillus gottheilii]